MNFAELAGLAGGHAEARAIQVAVKLGIFDLLSRGTLDEDGLSRALHCELRATALLANAMAGLGLLAKQAGRYGITETARRYLISSSAEFLGDMILFDEALFSTWVNLEETIRRGTPARAPDMYQTRPDETERFIRAMDSLTRARGDAEWVADHLDLGGVEMIADVGGGPGTYLAALLRRWPRLRASIYDLPATLEVARHILAEREPRAAGRIELREVDYLRDELPGPVGALFMSNIIHSEDSPTNARLMEKCFSALRAGGLVVIKDHIMNADLTEPRAGAVFSLYLMLTTRGRDYSFEEVAGWLKGAGFIAIRRETLPSPPFTSSIITARKP
jgi:3-hydroxy-5-methyl-1-naphthoate 3-O-methyltransferase